MFSHFFGKVWDLKFKIIDIKAVSGIIEQNFISKYISQITDHNSYFYAHVLKEKLPLPAEQSAASKT